MGRVKPAKPTRWNPGPPSGVVGRGGLAGQVKARALAAGAGSAYVVGGRPEMQSRKKHTAAVGEPGPEYVVTPPAVFAACFLYR
jgi:hypothetical protein